ncbi:invasin domain 3-containing protein, partial [Xenorhabdus mauleonii]
DGKELKPTQVVFGQSLADIVDTKGSAFIPATNVLASDNEDSTIMTLELKDKKGQPIRNAKDSITFEDNGDQLTGDGKNKPTIDKVWEEPENSGIYKVKVKAGDKNGHWKITTKIDGVALEKPTEITFDPNKADLVDPNKSTFVAKESELPNDGDTTVIEVDLKDHEGKVITGAENSIKMIPDDHGLYGSGKKMPTVGKFKETPPGSGHYQATVTAGDKKGKWELAPEVFGKKIEKTTTITFGKSLADKLNLKSPEVDPADGSTALPADGHTKKTLRITLKDGDNNPIYGAKDSIIVTGDYSTLKGDGKDPVIDKVKEVGDGVYEVVITAGTKTGNWAVTTTVDGKKNPQPLELEFDVNKAPSVVISHLEGELAIGKTLTANYKFNSNDSNTVDRSFYVWGAKGTTAARVIELAEKAGAKEPIELEQENGEGRVNGKPITYIIQENDKHKVLEVSILAANDANLRAKGPETMAVDDPRTATTITGGNGSGGVPDPNAVPEVDELDLTGKLELSSTLTVSYKFMPNGGDARDKSQFAWKILSKEGDAMNWQDVDQPAQGDNKGQAKLILEKELELEISGEVIVMSILPANF